MTNYKFKFRSTLRIQVKKISIENIEKPYIIYRGKALLIKSNYRVTQILHVISMVYHGLFLLGL